MFSDTEGAILISFSKNLFIEMFLSLGLLLVRVLAATDQSIASNLSL